MISKDKTVIKALIVLPKTLQGKTGVFFYSFLQGTVLSLHTGGKTYVKKQKYNNAHENTRFTQS